MRCPQQNRDTRTGFRMGGVIRLVCLCGRCGAWHGVYREGIYCSVGVNSVYVCPE